MASPALILSSIPFQPPVKIDVATIGDNIIVPKVTGKIIHVVAYHFVVGGPLTLIWRSRITPAGTITVLSGAESYPPNGGLATAAAVPLMSTLAGEDLVLNLSVAQQVSGTLTYYLA